MFVPLSICLVLIFLSFTKLDSSFISSSQSCFFSVSTVYVYPYFMRRCSHSFSALDNISFLIYMYVNIHGAYVQEFLLEKYYIILYSYYIYYVGVELLGWSRSACSILQAIAKLFSWMAVLITFPTVEYKIPVAWLSCQYFDIFKYWNLVAIFHPVELPSLLRLIGTSS